MTFVFDLDDTVCETNEFSKTYLETFFKENNWNFNQITQKTRFAEAKFDWETDTALQWYKVHGDEMMMLFPCKEKAVQYINALYEQGHRIVIATARGDDWHTNPVAITKLWLVKNKIKYSKLYTGRVDKEQICEVENADFFIDDDLKITAKVAEHFKDKKHVCIPLLMSSEFNKTQQEASGVIRVEDFYDFAEILKDFGIDINKGLTI